MTPEEIKTHERGIVAAMLADPSIIDEVSQTVEAAMLETLNWRNAFIAVVNMHEAGVSLSDSNLVGAAFFKHGVDELECTVQSVRKLRNEGFPHNRRYLVDEIRKAWKLRQLVAIGSRISSRAGQAESPEKVTEWLESQLDMLAAGGNGLQIRRAEQIADDVLAELQEAKAVRPGVMSGLYSLDNYLGPLMPGELAIIAARPGGGKTSLAMQMAQHIATHGPVLFVSLEMKDKELIRRSLSAISGINSRQLRESRIDSEDFDRLLGARRAMTGLELDICAPPKATASQIYGLAKCYKAMNGLRMVFIDYIGLVKPSGEDRRLDRHLQVGQITSTFKAMAKELDCPVVALAQLNRDAQNREPTLANLRESGSIEQDADIVLLIHHPEEGKAHIHIAKHRHGQTGVVRMLWSPETTSFVGNTTWTG